MSVPVLTARQVPCTRRRRMSPGGAIKEEGPGAPTARHGGCSSDAGHSCPVASASADTTLNIVPHGNVGPGVPWATAPGILPADTQAKMYDRITPLFRNITPDV